MGQEGPKSVVDAPREVPADQPSSYEGAMAQGVKELEELMRRVAAGEEITPEERARLSELEKKSQE